MLGARGRRIDPRTVRTVVHRAVADALHGGPQALTDLARDHYVLKLISRDEYFAVRAPLADRAARLRRAPPADPPAPPTISNWETMSFDQRRAVIVTYVEAVVVHPARPGYNRFDSTRVAVTWR